MKLACIGVGATIDVLVLILMILAWGLRGFKLLFLKGELLLSFGFGKSHGFGVVIANIIWYFLYLI